MDSEIDRASINAREKIPDSLQHKDLDILQRAGYLVQSERVIQSSKRVLEVAHGLKVNDEW